MGDTPHDASGAACPLGNLTAKGRRRRLIGGIVGLVGLAAILAVGPRVGPLWLYLAAAGALAGFTALSGLQSGSGT